MGLMKFAARKGAVGGTARWVADRFFEALANEVIDISNCRTPDGIKEEINKVIFLSLESRYYSEPNHPNKDAIMNYYENFSIPSLSGFTVAILAVEAEFHKNTSEYQSMFLDVINEELVKKGVGDKIIRGEL